MRGDLSGVQGLEEILPLRDGKEKKSSLLKWLSNEVNGSFSQWTKKQTERGESVPDSSSYLPAGAGLFHSINFVVSLFAQTANEIVQMV